MSRSILYLILFIVNIQTSKSQSKKELARSIDSLNTIMEMESFAANLKISILSNQIDSINILHAYDIESKKQEIYQLKNTVDILNEKIKILEAKSNSETKQTQITADPMFSENIANGSYVKLIEDLLIDNWVLVDNHAYMHEWVYKYKSTSENLEKVVILNGDGGSTITEEIITNNGNIQMLICYTNDCSGEYSENPNSTNDSNSYGITFFRDDKVAYSINEMKSGGCEFSNLNWHQISDSCSSTFEDVYEKYKYGIDFLKNKLTED